MYLEELSQYVMHSHRVPYRRAKLQVVLELLQGGQCEVHFLRTIVVGRIVQSVFASFSGPCDSCPLLVVNMFHDWRLLQKRIDRCVSGLL